MLRLKKEGSITFERIGFLKNENKPAKSTRILILGLGGVGYYLAKRLVHEGYAITVIEMDSKLIHHADGTIDARLIQGNAMSIACWKEAGAENMDYLISVTNNDELFDRRPFWYPPENSPGPLHRVWQ